MNYRKMLPILLLFLLPAFLFAETNRAIEPIIGLQIIVSEDFEFSYPEQDEWRQGVNRIQNAHGRHWEELPNGYANMSLYINSISGMEVVEGSEMAALTTSGLVAGTMIVTDAADTSWGMAIWGDDPGSDEIEGFVDGEEIRLLYWDPVHKWELDMSVEFLVGRELVYHSDTFTAIEVTLGVEDQKPPSYPQDFKLNSIYPNPFNSTTRISYSVPVRSYVNLKLYDLSGREVRTLFTGIKSAGDHHTILDGTGLQSGIYLIALESGDRRHVERVLLIK